MEHGKNAKTLKAGNGFPSVANANKDPKITILIEPNINVQQNSKINCYNL